MHKHKRMPMRLGSAELRAFYDKLSEDKLDEGAYMPTQEEIRAACREIQDGWSDSMRQKREVYGCIRLKGFGAAIILRGNRESKIDNQFIEDQSYDT